MISDSIQDRPASIENVSSNEVEAESNNIDSLEAVSSGGDATRELESAAEVLTRVELDLACSSEKLVNLEILVMHVASRENDFEAFASEEEHNSEGPVEKALEFDLLYGFLDSEVRELESFLSALQTEIAGFQASFEQLGDSFKEMEEKLQDCGDSLKRSFEQVAGLKVQSANFRRILLASSGEEKWKDDKSLENDNFEDSNAKIRMHTAEQQRNILKMLEKSLAREMDLEKKLTESRQTEEDLKLQLQQEVFCMEQEAEDIWERLFEAENNAEILLGISKELFGRIQMAQFSINGSVQREGELRSKLQDLTEELKDKDCALRGSEFSRTELVEKVNAIEQKLRESESQLHHVKEEQNKELAGKAIEAEKRAEIIEAECKLLRESKMELDKEMSRMKSSTADSTKRVDQLEKQLKDSEIQRLHAVASSEASQEKLSMLDCTIKDMDNLIKDLKLKVSRAESEIESTEEKCIILSESNAELIEEVTFLRRRVEHLETSLHQADEAKKESAKDIRVRTKLIADLVVQLALERERLHKQISSLTKEKKVAVMYLQQIKRDHSVTAIGSHDAKANEPVLSEDDSENEISRKGSSEEILGSLATIHETGNAPGDFATTEVEMEHTDSASNLNTVRNIDVRQIKFMYVCMVVLLLAISGFIPLLFPE
ncbi:WPP domain-interacting tail-anchored protein 1 isoform X1 [Sesamum indicum]|uniref:WPP domain-interacting tail-anchored protein 1 isoform X1 n=1 Tax=Sesamum indicum TaxID=4182 RepID=A0A6I9ULL9_SESIN|nr:WPP domain-interacting tail-anchored protein 1 isoform X1 [Sesamum indicum]XP_020554745.1 WPP domain-interacting tail-anchored protein 1 isoform X1 [Sesamum indicum]